MQLRELVSRAKQQLGIEHLALAIHDVSFPSAPEEDVGRGTPYSEGGGQLLRYASELGFDAIQLGPQGVTSAGDPSPYDATMFARNTVSLAVARLADEGWIRRADVRPVDGADPDWCDLVAAHEQMDLLAERVWRTHKARPRPEVVRALERFQVDQHVWLNRSGLRGDELDRFTFLQYLAHGQHAALRDEARALGLALFGDLHVGMARREESAYRDALFPGYRLGAPPSRTNPEGQPWGYAVLHPAQRSANSPANLLIRARFDKALSEYDAVRIDHPHGLVCPWVYRDDLDDPVAAVQAGARLFSSPNLPDHPALARFSIVQPGQLDPTRARYDEDWVAELSEAQIEAYAVWMTVALDCARRAGRGAESLICEILSTRPRPLAEVSRRIGLGRFRVSQKANLDDPDDVYRPSNAAAEDWVMIGTHDTASIWELFERFDEQRRRHEAQHLAEVLALEEQEVGALAAQPGALARAKLAELLVCPARHVMLFFADLFGLRERYNTPGTVGPQNWRLRLPHDFRARHRRALGAGQALDVAGAFALALRARGCRDGALIAALEAMAEPVAAR